MFNRPITFVTKSARCQQSKNSTLGRPFVSVPHGNGGRSSSEFVGSYTVCRLSFSKRVLSTGTSACNNAGHFDYAGRRCRTAMTNNKWTQRFFMRALVLSTGTCSAMYGLYSFKNNFSVVNAQKLVADTEDSPQIKLTLYQYQTCPFCCKVRAFLDYSGLPYRIVEVNPVFRQQIKFSKSWRKVPILIVEGSDQHQQLNDSSLIVSLLSSMMLDQSKSIQEFLKFYPVVSYVNEQGKNVDEVHNRYFLMCGDKMTRSQEDIDEERKWRMWADSRLVHMLSPNVYRSPREALQAFRWFSIAGDWETHFSFIERAIVMYVGAAAMYLIGKRLKKRHMLNEDVRKSLYDVCNEWLVAVGTCRPFMGGNKPNLADLAVYGVLSSIEGCHTFNDVLNNTDIKPWFFRMKTLVNSHSGSVKFKGVGT